MDFDTVMLLAIPASFIILWQSSVDPVGSGDVGDPILATIGLAAFAGTLMVYVGAPLLIVPHLPPMAIVDLHGWGIGRTAGGVLTTFFGYWAPHHALFRRAVARRHQLHHGAAGRHCRR
jgi:hypothetical protein